MIRLLGACKRIDVGAVVRDENEIPQVPVDEGRLVFRPQVGLQALEL
jgi:hypothetical protein